jgi:hypothetical protein
LHGAVEGGEGRRLNEEEEGRWVGSLEEAAAVGVAALRCNSSGGRGVPVLEHPLDVVVVLRGEGVLGRLELGAERKGGVWRRWARLICDAVGSGGLVVGGSMRLRGRGSVGPGRGARGWHTHRRRATDAETGKGGGGPVGPRYSPKTAFPSPKNLK